jgi:small neutral amino acid transporter SnatA (MarC family)
VTRGTDLDFQRTVAWQSTAIATVIALGVAVLAPLVLGSWHVSPQAVSITAGTILFFPSAEYYHADAGERCGTGRLRDDQPAADRRDSLERAQWCGRSGEGA